MALKEEMLRKGLQKGIDGEQRRVSSRFDLAEKTLAEHPAGLISPRVGPQAAAEAVQPVTFTGESSLPLGREILAIPVDSVEDNPFNARQIYNPEKVRELAASIVTHGQKVPATAMRHPAASSRYILIDGHYRKQAIKAAGRHHLDVVLEPALDSTELYRLSYMLNQERNTQSVLDNALAWRHLLDTQTIAKEEQLAALTGQSWATVNKTLAILKLPQSVIARMRDAPEAFGIAIAYELTLLNKIVGEAKTLQIAERVLAEGLGRRDVEELRKSAEISRLRKKKEVSRQYRIRSEQGQQIGFIKEWDSGRVSVEVRVAEPKEREALVDELKRRFGVD
jgi:ParB family chromosome partitioning protein